jgi:predicted acylesterase/phospholipase RssA
LSLFSAHLTRMRMSFTIDVIAGTSAGGINGVLLATGIARRAPLTGLRELWMHAPQLARKKGLMAPQGRKAASVLNGSPI